VPIARNDAGAVLPGDREAEAVERIRASVVSFACIREFRMTKRLSIRLSRGCNRGGLWRVRLGNVGESPGASSDETGLATSTLLPVAGIQECADDATPLDVPLTLIDVLRQQGRILDRLFEDGWFPTCCGRRAELIVPPTGCPTAESRP